MKRAKTKVTRKKPTTKAELIAQIKDLEGSRAWATNIIASQQKEVDRLMKLTESLTQSIANMSRSLN